MQLMENWDPLNLPRGSVRAIVALAITGALWATMLLGREVPTPLAFVDLLILGYYFGYRGGASVQAGQRPPLYLPRGSIRTLLVVGFGAVAFFLYQEGRLRPVVGDDNFTILVLVGSLILGFIVKVVADLVTGGKAVAPRRWFENTKAVLAIIAAGAFLLFCFVDPTVARLENLHLFAAPVLMFYLGSRD